MPAELLGRITVFCFAASYAVAFAVELFRTFQARPALRWLALAFTGAGIVAHTAFVTVNKLPLQTSFGSLIFLAWILAVFCFYGAVHHRRLAWELFVLPLVLGLVLLAQLFPMGAPSGQSSGGWQIFDFEDMQFWAVLHGILMLLAFVGISVGFVASVMFLVQTHRLKTKQLPGQGLKLWSLERLEAMNRRSIMLAFPLLTSGLLIAAWQMFGMPDGGLGLENWKVLSTVALWIVFAVLLYLRYSVRAGGKQVALLTIAAFGLMLVALIAVHPFTPGGAP
ncbi:MAG TPA: cytochrome c biogenesis protein CcsA [Gemmataceae bacterium]|nr:cytochrome c biogenesis protein CcsA [Gemmataceae bacterium]